MENRTWGHLAKIKQDENKYKKNKLYWILGRLNDLKVGLHCYLLEEYPSWNRIDIKTREKENIRLLKPVLNT